MDAKESFRPIPTMTTDEVRTFIESKKRDEFNLIDVRQPDEYEKSHVPGATLIPLHDLTDRFGEIERDRPTVVYCRSGRRSASAVGLLLDLGFTDIFNMEGGILQWEGMTSEGGPTAGMAYFPPDASFEDIAALAWLMEEGTGRFYSAIEEWMADKEMVALFTQLVKAEDHHKNTIADIYRNETGKELDETIAEWSAKSDGETIEGGMKLDAALEWAEGKSLVAILSFAMSMETSSYDLYLLMIKRTRNERARALLQRLAEEEREHLKKLASLLDVKL